MVRLEGVSMTFPDGHRALDTLDLDVESGHFVAVIGGSGSGKSTLLRLVAGLETPTSGTVTVGDATVEGPRREVGVMFQEPRLMPWLSVADNVTFGLRDVAEAERTAIAAGILGRVGLTGFAGMLPRQLSGGMAQRVALARALVGDPGVLLLDEPFSAVDALTRAELQDHLLEVWTADRRTVLLVTHDIDEAIRLADTVVVLTGRPGAIVERFDIDTARPRDPADPSVARLRARAVAALGPAAHA
jgi:sulfonate transport system ATP-binding protein